MKLEYPSRPLDFLFFKSLIILVISSSFVGVKNIEAETFALVLEYSGVPGVKLHCSLSTVSVKY
jgi:hypothetical protein